MDRADPGGRAVLGVGVLWFVCWDCGLEFRWGHVEIPSAGRSLVHMSPTDCVWVCVCVIVIRCNSNPLHLQRVGRKWSKAKKERAGQTSTHQDGKRFTPCLWHSCSYWRHPGHTQWRRLCWPRSDITGLHSGNTFVQISSSWNISSFRLSPVDQ